MGKSISLDSMLLCPFVSILKYVCLEHIKIRVIFGKGGLFRD